MPYPPFITILLSELPKAQYTNVYDSDRYLITYEAALRILSVTQAKDHKFILTQCLSWNRQTKEEQHYDWRGDDHCEISAGVIGNTFYMSVNRMSDTESVYLTLYHDREQVSMDIQLP
jgi:hypothetical protein